jgi:sortase A
MTEEAEGQQVAPEVGAGGDAEQGGNELQPAKDKTLKLTVPKMAEIKDDEIPTGKGTDEALFRDYAAVRLPYTGFPWQREANIYIAGHRVGYPGTNSDLAFYDLEDLANGDEVYLEDAMGRQYTYEVFSKKIVEPTDLSVLKRVEGKNILTLQTCTLPDYSDRVVYQAELKNIKT